MSPVARAGLALGAVLGLLPLLFAGGWELSTGSVVFLAMIFCFALLPYVVLAWAERRWSRPLAIAALAVLGAAHVAATVAVIETLDEDALSAIGFLTIPPVLAAGVLAVAACAGVWRAVAQRRGQPGAERSIAASRSSSWVGSRPSSAMSAARNSSRKRSPSAAQRRTPSSSTDQSSARTAT